MADEKRDFGEMKGTYPNANEILCKDCVFRDKTVVKIENKTIPVGVTKSFCEVFEAPPKTNGKPTEILFHNGDCEYYKKDNYY